ncbi:MAG: 50S ribosomal protein L9 [Patescibacteria group bacterium]
MKVILLHNIKGFGKIGDVKNVSDGHARNFLFPKNLAKIASEGALKDVETLQARREAMDLKDKENAQRVVAVLEKSKLEFGKKASKAGTLFSSVTKQEIAHQVSKMTAVTIGADMIHLEEKGEHIKHVGEHTATIDLGNNLKAQVKIIVRNE